VRRWSVWLVVSAGVMPLLVQIPASADAIRRTNPRRPRRARSRRAPLLDRYCVGCHGPRVQSGKLRLDTADTSAVGAHGEVWERVTRKLREA